MQRLSKTVIEEIRTRMSGLEGSAAAAEAQKLAAQFGCDPTRIYHHTRDLRPQRNPRADRGKMKTMPEQTFEKLSVLTVQGGFSAPHIMQIAQGNGLETIAPATYNRHLRRLRIGLRDLKKDYEPYQSWEANFSNHIHQVDSTIAQQFYLDGEAIGFEPLVENYKNRPGNKKPRLTLLALVDDHSRCLFARFALSNTQRAWMNFLYEAWKDKGDPYFPFHGVPRILYSDQFIKSNIIRRAGKQLGITIIAHKPYHPRSKGKVENAIKFIQQFEKVTRFAGWKNLAEANAALYDWLIWANNRQHGTTKERPFARWTAGLRIDKFVAPPAEEIFELLHLEPVQRKIAANLTISLGGKTWALPMQKPFTEMVDMYLEIYWRPGNFERLWAIVDNKEYEITYHDIGIVSQQPDRETPVAVARRERLQTANMPDLKLTGFYKEQYGQPYMLPQAAEMNASSIMPQLQGKSIMRTKIWFIRQLQSDFLIASPPSAEELAWVDQLFGNETELPETKLREAAAGLVDQTTGELKFKPPLAAAM